MPSKSYAHRLIWQWYFDNCLIKNSFKYYKNIDQQGEIWKFEIEEKNLAIEMNLKVFVKVACCNVIKYYVNALTFGHKIWFVFLFNFFIGMIFLILVVLIWHVCAA